MINKKRKLGQVWIETVLYTLIGLVLLGLVLSFVYPRIKATQEKVLIDQTIESMQAFDSIVTTVLERGPGNTKSYELTMKKGSLTIDGKADTVTFIIPDLSSKYSDPGTIINDGRLSINTTIGQKSNSVILQINYSASNINITLGGSDIARTFNQAPTPYTFFVKDLISQNPDGSAGHEYVCIEEQGGPDNCPG